MLAMKMAVVLLVVLLAVLIAVPPAHADCPVGFVFVPVGQYLHCGPDPFLGGMYNCWWEQYGLCVPVLVPIVFGADALPLRLAPGRDVICREPFPFDRSRVVA